MPLSSAGLNQYGHPLRDRTSRNGPLTAAVSISPVTPRPNE